ncbi:hypothetical protein SARC_09983 [Sphaeroforma arctica JP610]|uniref:Uncharacterized protein n=1 Tax=Sphaeroforma arctica JP610 TaxID=667725 RepID=A0A0L0FLE1_9EUKA|nr:hypothetical protein SARC_09983 [Sphaeroforma arctica JP610]KNC77560.1 hypothetical protein SARC_09983 [Sphaeroforma arctica JP610]|eukprot:XP_014151462.1 hypothetical protein SARC_09983 [Sphaeroforma arctica JP610]
MYGLHVLCTNHVSRYATDQYDNDPAPTSVTQIELFCDYKPEGSKFTWEDLQNDTNPLDDVKVKIPCKVNIIDDVDGGTRNCMVKQSRYADIKSYTIKFDDKTQTWRGLDRLLLKKDSGDKSHLRSKVVFDTFKKMDLSIWETFRTHFTHLEVQLKVESGNVDIEDMGIYTNIEKGNEDWIETRYKDGSGDL